MWVLDMMLVGILISSAKKEVLSVNTSNPLNFGPDSRPERDRKPDAVQGHSYRYGKILGTYVKDSVDGISKMTYFHVEMEKKDQGEKFTLIPT